MRRLFLSFVSALLFVSVQAQQADIQITTPVSDPQVLAAMEYTASIWEQQLSSPVPIKVNVLLFPVSGAFLGFTFPNGRKDFPGAPLEETWYPSCLANAMTGTELNPGESDMDIVMAADVTWYFGIDGQPGSQQYDFVSVLLHEIGHGLGIVSLSDSQNGVGSFGMIDFSQFAPFQPTFPIPQLNGLPGAYDRLLATGSGQVLSDASVFPNPSSMLHATFTGNNVFFTGEEAIAANGNQQPKIFAPPVFAFGTSISHLDESSYPSQGGNSLMTPYINKGEAEHTPGPLALAILRDIGWTVETSATVTPPNAGLDARILGLCRESILQISLPSPGDLEWMLADARGQVIYHQALSGLAGGLHQIPLQQAADRMSAGYYIVQVIWNGSVTAIPFVLSQ